MEGLPTTMSAQSTVASVDPLSPTTHVAVDESIVAAARDVGSIIAKHVETTERNRRLAPPVIDALRAAGLFRLFTPRALGGLEIDPVTFARVVEEVSAFDSALERNGTAGRSCFPRAQTSLPPKGPSGRHQSEPTPRSHQRQGEIHASRRRALSPNSRIVS